MQKFYPPAEKLNDQAPDSRQASTAPYFDIFSLVSFGLAAMFLLRYFRMFSPHRAPLTRFLFRAIAYLEYPIEWLPPKVQLLAPPTLLIFGLSCGIIAARTKRRLLLGWIGGMLNAVTLAGLCIGVGILLYILSGIKG